MWPQSWPGPLAALPALSPAEQQPKGTSIADAVSMSSHGTGRQWGREVTSKWRHCSGRSYLLIELFFGYGWERGVSLVLWDSANVTMTKPSITHFVFYALAFLVSRLNPSCPVTLEGCQNSNSLYYTELFLKLHGDVQVWAVLFFLQSKMQPSHFWSTAMKQSQYVPIFKGTSNGFLLFGKSDRILFICLL